MYKDMIAPTQSHTPVKKTQRFGKEIVETIYKRDIDAGGSNTLITGAPGCSKTSLMLSLSQRIVKNNPSELVFWSSCYDSPMQFFRLPYQILVKKGSGVKFFDRYKQEYIDLPHQTFDSFEELYQKSKPGILNVPFFGNRFIWMDFIEWSLKSHRWTTMLLDELGEIAPALNKGPLYDNVIYFAQNVIGKTRKCKVTVISNTHAPADVAWQVLKKLNNYIFLPGARVPKNKVRVWQRAVDGLRYDRIHGHQAYICAGGRFGVIECRDVFTPVPNWSVDARIEEKENENNGRKQKSKTKSNKVNKRRHSKISNSDDKLHKWEVKRKAVY